MPFTTRCPLCPKNFKTGTSLSKHLTIKHPRSKPEKVRFVDETGKTCEEPKATTLHGAEKVAYLRWLAVLAERINSSLVPEHPGKHIAWGKTLNLLESQAWANLKLCLSSPAKWRSVDCFQVPSQYFTHMLQSLGSPGLDSVREVRHRRQPIFKRSSRRLSYKIYDEELFRTLLEDQSTVQYKSGALFCNDEEVPDISDMNVEDAIAFAKQRARQKSRPTSRSVMDIGLGEGRKTREVEFIWWPSLYSCSSYGKLMLRFYVKKTSI